MFIMGGWGSDSGFVPKLRLIGTLIGSCGGASRFGGVVKSFFVASSAYSVEFMVDAMRDYFIK